MKIPFTSINVPIRIPEFIRRHKWRWIIGLVIFFVFILPAYLLTRPKQASYVTAPVQRMDLFQTVEAVGTVTSEKDLNLQFKNAGIVSEVYVKEGQRVFAGQRLAGLKAGGLGASIASAQASVAEAEANLQELMEGSRPEDIAIQEASLENKKASLAAAQDGVISAQHQLDALQNEVDVTQAGDVSLAANTISQQVTLAEQAISAVQDILRNNDLQDAIARGSAGNYYTIQQQMNSLPSQLDAATSAAASVTDVKSAIAAYQTLRTALLASSTVLDQVFTIVSNTQLTSYYTQDNRTAYKTAINSERSSIQSSLATINAAINNLQQAPASLATRLSAAQSSLNNAKADVLTFQTAVRIQQAQLDLAKAGARQTDIDAARARVNLAKAQLSAAAANYSDTQIIAPVAGIVTKIAIKAGEASPLGTAIGMMGDSPYRIEMYVSEVDVPKLHEGQTGSIVLDAFRGETLPLRVAVIDDSATNKDGVPKYRVKLDFVTPREDLRFGMTGDAAIVTGSRIGVLTVPQRAVLAGSGSTAVVRVLEGKDLIQKTVTTGMEGDSDIEVLSGLKEGETVIVLVKQ